ncbi:MAG: hypothetical protein C4308_10950 [Chitinophagaceae bacterium]
MDRFDSVRLYTPASDYCTKCGMHTQKHGCCHDEVKIVKLQDDHQVSAFSFALKQLQPQEVLLPDFAVTLSQTSLLVHHFNHSPPLLPDKQHTYLQNCVFRI